MWFAIFMLCLLGGVVSFILLVVAGVILNMWLKETAEQKQMRLVLTPLFKSPWLWHRMGVNSYTMTNKGVRIQIGKTWEYINHRRINLGSLDVDDKKFKPGGLLDNTILGFVENLEKQHDHDERMQPVRKLAESILASEDDIKQKELDWFADNN